MSAHGTQRFRALQSNKKQAILSVAAHEFALYGYLAASTNRIAVQARISKGALFSYFVSKEELFVGVVSDLFDSIRRERPELVLAPSRGSFHQMLLELAARVWVFNAQWPVLFALDSEITFRSHMIPQCDLLRAEFSTLFESHIEQMLRSAFETQELARDLSPEAARLLILATFDRLRNVSRWGVEHPAIRFEPPTSERYQEIAERAISTLMRAVGR
ncbi:MAG: TetR/AcrR family transcriptional regulator [Deltaproteobacteria bacterium]|nr:TetR/AcrR family transcriptional regulator [Deltaproteobacteria bacterium]